MKLTEKHAKSGKSRRGKGATLVLLAGTLCMAVYLNWSFAQRAPVQQAAAGEDTASEEVLAEETGQAAEVAAGADALTETAPVFDPLEDPAQQAAAGEGDKNYGEAQLVSVNQDTGSQFFDEARLSRTKTRDAALDALKTSLKSSSLSEEEKSELTGRLSEQVNSITAESELETQIKAKGFADCVVFLSDGKASVTVMTENDALTADEVTQIRDLILRKCKDLTAQDITVVEVK